MESESNIRKTVVFRGVVQGIGFRYHTRLIAQRYEVVGYVENEDDGSVHLTIEGNASEIEAFIADIQKAFEGYIYDVEMEDSPAMGEFSDFSVRV